MLDANSHKIMESMIRKALQGDSKAAAWLLAHTAVPDASGNELRPTATGIDRPSEQPSNAGDSAPRILIGVALGADFARLNTDQTGRPALPPIDVSPSVSPGK